MDTTTLKVVLAMPYDGKEADSTVELDRLVALDLIHTGRARLAETSKAKTSAAPKTSAAKAEGN